MGMSKIYQWPRNRELVASFCHHNHLILMVAVVVVLMNKEKDCNHKDYFGSHNVYVYTSLFLNPNSWRWEIIDSWLFQHLNFSHLLVILFRMRWLISGCFCMFQIFSCGEHWVWNIATASCWCLLWFLSTVGPVCTEWMELELCAYIIWMQFVVFLVGDCLLILMDVEGFLVFFTYIFLRVFVSLTTFSWFSSLLSFLQLAFL